MIEDWLHDTDGDFYITAGFAKDLADVVHWSRKWCKEDSLMRGEDGQAYRYHSDQAWQAQTYLRSALARLDARNTSGDPDH
jgi:hypothetical protein